MTIYRLPEALGSPEFDGVREGTCVGFTSIPGVTGTLWFHHDDVTEVVVGPMPEPPQWAVVGIQEGDGAWLVLQRQPTVTVHDGWFIAGDAACEPHTWEWVLSKGSPVLFEPGEPGQPARRPRSCPTCHSPGLPRFVRDGDNGRRGCTDQWHQHLVGEQKP